MTLLAGSSAVLAPLMLYALLPLVSGHDRIAIDLTKMLGVLLATQFVPLCVGLAIRHWRPGLAESIRRPANSLGLILNLILVTWIVATHYSLFGQLDVIRLVGMSALLLFCLVTGWLFGGPGSEDRKALALTTSLRNVGLSLVIAITAFPETPAVTAVLGYGFFEILGSLLLAAFWRKTGRSTIPQ
jgi:BASS family bile acid:Na+ symporter